MSYPEWQPDASQAHRLGQRGGAFSMNMDTPESDAGLAVRFFVDPRPNDAKSKAAGRLICDEVEMVEIRVAGSADCVRHEVSEADANRFRRQYEAFKAGHSQDKASGTPLAEWPLMRRGQVEEAAYKGIRTVEQMANVSDGSLQQLGPGWRELRDQAQKWLATSKSTAAISRLAEAEKRIETLEAMLAKQAAELEAARNGAVPSAPAPDLAALVAQQVQAALAAQPKPKRGRPPKTQEG